MNDNQPKKLTFDAFKKMSHEQRMALLPPDLRKKAESMDVKNICPPAAQAAFDAMINVFKAKLGKNLDGAVSGALTMTVLQGMVCVAIEANDIMFKGDRKDLEDALDSLDAMKSAILSELVRKGWK